MKKAIMCVYVCLIVAIYPFKIANADEGVTIEGAARVENYISGLYHQIDFGKSDRLSYEVFDKAYRGYLNLKEAGKITSDKEIISVCDFSLPSTANRLWIIDLGKKKVLFNTYVAHGQGSGDDFAWSFSNTVNSHKSSLGFYVTGATYNGEHGTSLRLAGMDEGFNDAAMERGIVMHAASYVCDKFVKGRERLGRSWGCPAVAPKLSLPIINTIKDGTCLFIYYPEKKYLNTSAWLNQRIANVPENAAYMDIISGTISKPTQKRIEYITNGKTDSVKFVPLVH